MPKQSNRQAVSKTALFPSLLHRQFKKIPFQDRITQLKYSLSRILTTPGFPPLFSEDWYDKFPKEEFFNALQVCHSIVKLTSPQYNKKSLPKLYQEILDNYKINKKSDFIEYRKLAFDLLHGILASEMMANDLKKSLDFVLRLMRENNQLVIDYTLLQLPETSFNYFKTELYKRLRLPDNDPQKLKIVDQPNILLFFIWENLKKTLPASPGTSSLMSIIEKLIRSHQDQHQFDVKNYPSLHACFLLARSSEFTCKTEALKKKLNTPQEEKETEEAKKIKQQLKTDLEETQKKLNITNYFLQQLVGIENPSEFLPNSLLLHFFIFSRSIRNKQDLHRAAVLQGLSYNPEFLHTTLDCTHDIPMQQIDYGLFRKIILEEDLDAPDPDLKKTASDYFNKNRFHFNLFAVGSNQPVIVHNTENETNFSNNNAHTASEALVEITTTATMDTSENTNDHDAQNSENNQNAENDDAIEFSLENLLSIIQADIPLLVKQSLEQILTDTTLTQIGKIKTHLAREDIIALTKLSTLTKADQLKLVLHHLDISTQQELMDKIDNTTPTFSR